MNESSRIKTSACLPNFVRGEGAVVRRLYKGTPRGFKFYDLKFDSDAFLQDLHNASFNVMEFFHDVNDKLFAFESLYLDIMGTHL